MLKTASLVITVATLGCHDKALQAEADRAKAEAAKATAEAAVARGQAEAEQSARQQAEHQRAAAEAPSRIATTPLGCTCKPGKVIEVNCSVKSAAEVPTVVRVVAEAATGFTGAKSKGEQRADIPAGGEVVVTVPTKFQGLMNCTSCSAPSCRMGSVTAE